MVQREIWLWTTSYLKKGDISCGKSHTSVVSESRRRQLSMASSGKSDKICQLTCNEKANDTMKQMCTMLKMWWTYKDPGVKSQSQTTNLSCIFCGLLWTPTNCLPCAIGPSSSQSWDKDSQVSPVNSLASLSGLNNILFSYCYIKGKMPLWHQSLQHLMPTLKNLFSLLIVLSSTKFLQ